MIYDRKTWFDFTQEIVVLFCVAAIFFALGWEGGLNRFVNKHKKKHVALYYACEESCQEYDNIKRR